MEREVKETAIKLGALVVILILFFLFTYPKTCNTSRCFNPALLKCRPAKYISETKEASWLYTIKGKASGMCMIDVKLLQAKEGAYDLGGIEGKSMICELPIGIIADPSSDINMCHGILKEEIQSMIIQKLHSYIFENLGQIGEGLEQIF